MMAEDKAIPAAATNNTLEQRGFLSRRARKAYIVLFFAVLLTITCATRCGLFPPPSDCYTDCECDRILGNSVGEDLSCPDCLWEGGNPATLSALCATGYPICQGGSRVDRCATFRAAPSVTPGPSLTPVPRQGCCWAVCNPNASVSECRPGLSCQPQNPAFPEMGYYHCFDQHFCNGAFNPNLPYDPRCGLTLTPSCTPTPYIPPGNPCRCGDHLCDPTCHENYDNCSADCFLPTEPSCSCGDGRCDPVCGEDSSTCAQDCGASPPPQCSCGDGVCSAGCGENNSNCPTDCVPQGVTCSCGDGTCDPLCSEDQNTCPQDCGYPCACGDGKCDGACKEDSNTCPQDCGYPCACGDGKCDGACKEDSSTCPTDCGPP